MKIKIRQANKNKIVILLVYLIEVFVFISSWFDIIYERATVSNIMYNRLYRYSIYVIVLLCLIFMSIYIEKRKTIPKIVMNMLVIFLYGSFISFVMDLFSIKAIVVDNLAWILVFCVFFILGKTNILEQRNPTGLIIIGMIIYTILLIPNLRLHMLGLDPKGGIISPLYYSLGFLGLIMMYCNNANKVIFSTLVGMMILISTKRTGLFVFVLGLLAFFYISALIEGQVKQRIKKYGRIIVVLVVGFVVGFWAIEHFKINIVERISAISVDGGSGRDRLWQMVFQGYSNSSLFHKVFGHGFHAVPELIRPFNRYLFAHNGFLEVLFDFGIIGLIGMIIGILWLLKCEFKMIKIKSKYAPVMGYTLCIIVLFSLTAYLFEESRFILPVAMICGMCIGDLKKRERMKTKWENIKM